MNRAKRTRAVLDAICAAMPTVPQIPKVKRNPFENAWGRVDPKDADKFIAEELRRARERTAARAPAMKEAAE